MSCRSSFKNCKHFRLKIASQMVWISLGNLMTTIDLCRRKIPYTKTLRVITGGSDLPNNFLRPEVKHPIVFAGRGQWGDLSEAVSFALYCLCREGTVRGCVRSSLFVFTLAWDPVSTRSMERWQWTRFLQVSAQASLSQGGDPDGPTLTSNSPSLSSLLYSSLQLTSSCLLLGVRTAAIVHMDVSVCALFTAESPAPRTVPGTWWRSTNGYWNEWTVNTSERSQWFYLQRCHSQLVSTSSLSDFG